MRRPAGLQPTWSRYRSAESSPGPGSPAARHSRCTSRDGPTLRRVLGRCGRLSWRPGPQGLWRQLLDCVQNRLTPCRVLGVDDGDAVRHHEDGGVAAAALAAQHEQVVLEFLDFDDPPATRTALNTAVRFMTATSRLCEDDEPLVFEQL